MNDETFKALVLRQQDEITQSSIEMLSRADLPEGDVLVQVEYSDLNYKDAMAVSGKGPIVRTWPMVPGIDLAGTVIESECEEYRAGDKVVLTGWGVGERYWGGYAQRQRVKSEWLIPLPKDIDTKTAMGIGTAGLTAMLCILRLEDAGIRPDSGRVLVTGATGGVGSISTAILSGLGYEVAALTRSDDEEVHSYLRELGASAIVDGKNWANKPNRLEKQEWAAAIDAVGSQVLARILAQMNYGGAVAACGLAGGADLPTTVMPFILRNVSLIGVDSVSCPNPRRSQAWERLATDLPESSLSLITHVCALEEVSTLAAEMIGGRTHGRSVIDLSR